MLSMVYGIVGMPHWHPPCGGNETVPVYYCISRSYILSMVLYGSLHAPPSSLWWQCRWGSRHRARSTPRPPPAGDLAIDLKQKRFYDKSINQTSSLSPSASRVSTKVIFFLLATQLKFRQNFIIIEIWGCWYQCWNWNLGFYFNFFYLSTKSIFILISSKWDVEIGI
jgi:hypothetical protein